jgi:fructoselysine-6-P-deglycase FrlB-like protein
MKLDDVLVIGISQSGESKDVLETVRRSGVLGASTLSVTNDAGSSMARVADHHLFLRAGEEESVAATKTYTASLLLLYLLVEALSGEEEPGAEARRLPEGAREVLEAGWEGRNDTGTLTTSWLPRAATTSRPPKRPPSSSCRQPTSWQRPSRRPTSGTGP